MNNQWRVIVAAIAVLAFTVFFQNCSELNPENNDSGSSLATNQDNSGDGNTDVLEDETETETETETGTPADPTPQPVMFAQGEAYSVRKIPYRFTDDATLNRLAGYLNRTGFKAMAFTNDGDLYIGSTNSTLVSGQAEWDQIVLERCQLEYVGKLCSLFASDGVIAQDRADFLNNFVNRITVPAQFDPNFVPGHLFHWRQRNTYNDFSNGEFKSYAVGARGAATAGWSRTNQADATRRALEICEAFVDQPCVLYAVARDVVFDINDYDFGPRRVFYGPRAFDVDQVPFIMAPNRENLRTAWQQAQQQGRHLATAMDRYGRLYFETQADPFNANGLEALRAECTSRINDGSNRACFIYSVDGNVVMTRQSWVDANAGL